MKHFSLSPFKHICIACILLSGQSQLFAQSSPAKSREHGSFKVGFESGGEICCNGRGSNPKDKEASFRASARRHGWNRFAS